MQPGEGLDRQPGLLLRAPRDLIALHRGGHIGEQQDEIGSVVGDVAVEAARDRDRDLVGDVGVELHLGAVSERDALANGIVLRGQLDRERARQVGPLGGVRRRHPVGRAGLTGADRRDVDVRTSAPSTDPSHAGVTSDGPAWNGLHEASDPRSGSGAA